MTDRIRDAFMSNNFYLDMEKNNWTMKHFQIPLKLLTTLTFMIWNFGESEENAARGEVTHLNIKDKKMRLRQSFTKKIRNLIVQVFINMWKDKIQVIAISVTKVKRGRERRLGKLFHLFSNYSAVSADLVAGSDLEDIIDAYVLNNGTSDGNFLTHLLTWWIPIAARPSPIYVDPIR